MRLNYLNTTNVKGLPDDHYNLRDVTYIQGNNRSGKSAILQAVQYAVFGRCDEIGSKGVGALIRSGQTSCSIECGGDLLVFRATISVNKKGAVSQERSCTYEGKEITEKELQKMFGGIPNTIAQFLELTGEETWRLIMPSQGGENALPEHIQRLTDTLVGKLKESEFSTSGITAHMSGEADSYSRATALLEAINASQREVRDKARAVIKALESPPEPYTGPSMGDLRFREKELKDQIGSLQAMLKSRTNDQQTLKYNEAQIANLQSEVVRLLDSVTPLSGSLETRKQLLEQASELLDRMPDFVDASDYGNTGFFADKVEKLLECIAGFNPDHELLKKSTEFSELVQEYITQNTYHPGEDEYFDNLFNGVAIKVKAIWNATLKPTRKAASSIVQTIKLSIDTLANDIANTEAGIQNRNIRIESLQKESLEIQVRLQESTDTSKLESIGIDLQQVQDAIKLATEYNNYISSAQDARTYSTQLQSLDPFFDQLILELQEFRLKAMKDGISLVQDRANAILGYCALPHVILEPVTGKRPSLVIKNASGSLYAAMSGAERLIYGASILIAIGAVRNVATSLLFLEGGELDDVYTRKLLLALSNEVKNGNVLIAHWCKADVIGHNVGVINV